MEKIAVSFGPQYDRILLQFLVILSCLVAATMIVILLSEEEIQFFWNLLLLPILTAIACLEIRRQVKNWTMVISGDEIEIEVPRFDFSLRAMMIVGLILAHLIALLIEAGVAWTGLMYGMAVFIFLLHRQEAKLNYFTINSAEYDMSLEWGNDRVIFEFAMKDQHSILLLGDMTRADMEKLQGALPRLVFKKRPGAELIEEELRLFKGRIQLPQLFWVMRS